jgi:hypothetical protein
MEQGLQSALQAGGEEAEDCRHQEDEKCGLPHRDSLALRKRVFAAAFWQRYLLSRR